MTHSKRHSCRPSTSSQPVFLVRTSQAQEDSAASTPTDPACGAKCCASPQLPIPTSSYSRMSRTSFLETEVAGCTHSSRLLPIWGTMQNGALSPLSSSVHLISVKGYGLLPTPAASDGRWGHFCTLKQAINHMRSPRPARWIHVALLCTRSSKGWANPRFAEAMMGFPTGWTDLRPAETPSIQRSPSSSGVES